MENKENVTKYQDDICKALGVEHREIDIVYPFYFLTRFEPQQLNYLETNSLINRGFCPDCGKSPIDSYYHRDNTINPNIKQYVCKECWDAQNTPTRRKYMRRISFMKFVIWGLGIGILFVLFLLIKSCVKIFF